MTAVLYGGAHAIVDRIGDVINGAARIRCRVYALLPLHVVADGRVVASHIEIAVCPTFDVVVR